MVDAQPMADEGGRIERRTALKAAIAAGAGATAFASPAINGISVVPRTAQAQSAGGPAPFTVTTDSSGNAISWNSDISGWFGGPQKYIDLGTDGYLSATMVTVFHPSDPVGGKLQLRHHPALTSPLGYRAPSGYTCTFTMSGTGGCGGLSETGMNPTNTDTGNLNAGSHVKAASDGDTVLCPPSGPGTAGIDVITCTPI